MSAVTLIIEQNVSGHRLSYVRLISDRASATSRVIIALNPTQDDREEIALHLADLSVDVSLIWRSLGSLSAIEALSREVGATKTVVPDGDAIALQLARRRRWKGAGSVSVLIMRESLPSRWGIPVRTWAKRFMVARARNTKNARVVVLRSSTWAGETSYPIAIDPITLLVSPDRIRVVRALLAEHPERYWFGVVGAISSRKNVDMVAEAVAAMKAPVGLVIAGKVADESVPAVNRVSEAMSKRDVPFVVVDRLLADDELDAFVMNLDCVVLAHSNEGPSGIFGKAAAAGTRVVASGATSLRDDCDSWPEGAQWVPLDVARLATALSDAVALPPPAPASLPSGRSFADSLL